MKFKWLFIFIVLLFLLPYASWELKNDQVLNVAIVDKTVPDVSYKNHSGLVWLLNHFKYVKEDGKRYFVEEDYYGFFPKKNNTFNLKNLNDTETNYDLIYIADLYGVYDEYLNVASKQNKQSELLYGDLEKEEYEKIKSDLFKGIPLIAEFNTLTNITDPEIRASLSKILGVTQSGWIGRFFSDLSNEKEVPKWAIDNYEKQSEGNWKFKGPGFILGHKNGELLILSGSDLGINGSQFFLTEEGEEFLGKKIQANYYSWFEIVDVINEESVLASFQLDVTDSGASKLAEKGLSSTIPAVVKNKADFYTSYYFTGDFTPKARERSFYKYKGLNSFMAWLPFGNKKGSFYWDAYVPLMEKIFEDVTKLKNNYLVKKEPDIYKEDGVNFNTRTNNMDLQIYQDGEWRTLFVKGVNMGMALPGKWFTEFPSEEVDYLRWFKMIGEMNSNTIRVYTLMDPSFYKALVTYNQSSSNPLWLMQEVWPEEGQDDYLEDDYNFEFHKEIEIVVDAIHGNANVAERSGRAFGDYTADVSPYLLGYLVGRELEPDEVIETDTLNEGFVYKGDYLSAAAGSPTENWLAWSSDYLLSYEENTYGWQHPVAIVSWPTLDALQHDSEWNMEGDRSKLYNDKATVDIRNFTLGSKMKTGLFGAYHIYPNYPDFMNNEVGYDQYKDEEGRLRYGGYLQDFIDSHQGFPAIVAEFGLATGMGNAHNNPDGYHQGGMKEREQGEGIVRMTKAIHREGYAGALIFEWMDEWAKKTWTTEPFMIPYEHNVFWHNIIDPEQNYGILAIESEQPKNFDYTIKGSEKIETVKMHADQSFLYVKVDTKRAFDWSKDDLLIGIDTYDRNRGEFKYRTDLEIDSLTGMEYLLEIKGERDANLLVIPSYNIGSANYSSVVSKEGTFESIISLINRAGVRKDGTTYEALYENGSILNFGDFNGNYNHWNTKGSTLTIRIPWGRLNITDPTTHRVLDDKRKIWNLERDTLQTKETEGIQLSIVWLNKNENEIVELFPGGNELERMSPYKWQAFDAPSYRERLKKSYYYIQEYFDKLQ